MPEYTIGIDVGGTFTDVACLDSHGRSYQAKTPSTPENQALGVIQGIRSVAERVGTSDHQLLAETAIIVHGTTVATNIMLEWNGARTYMLTTRGFRDIVDLR